MARFTDSQQTPWSFALTVGSLARVKEALTIDLTDLYAGEPPLLMKLTTDLLLVGDVLYVLCEPQADSAGITKGQFLDRLDATTLGQARDALIEDLGLFFRNLKRDDVGAAFAKVAEMTTEGLRMAAEEVTKLDFKTELQKAINESRSGNSSTSSPASSASTPPLSPSDGSS